MAKKKQKNEKKPQAKRLYRSTKNKIIAGIAGGLGEYFGIDPTIFRLAFILSVFFNGGGLLFYLVLWVFMPLPRSTHKNSQEVMRENMREIKGKINAVASEIKVVPEKNEKNYWGALLIFFGLLLILNSLVIFHPFSNLIWPSILILIGFFLLVKKR